MFIAVDQSNAPRHFVVGSFWLPLSTALTFERKVIQLRIEHKYWREAHYKNLKKVDSRAYSFLKSLLSIALDPEHDMRIAIIVAANDKKTTKQFFSGNIQRDAVFMYELISRRYRWWKVESAPYVIFDDLTHHTSADDSDSEPEDDVSNEHIAKASRLLARDLEREVSCFAPCSSHISSAIQVADIIAGMTSLRWSLNAGEFAKTSANPARVALLEWFEEELGANLGVHTLPSKPRVSVWKHNSLS